MTDGAVVDVDGNDRDQRIEYLPGERVVVVAFLATDVESPTWQLTVIDLPRPVLLQVEEPKVVVGEHGARAKVLLAESVALLVHRGERQHRVHLQRVAPSVIESDPDVCRATLARRI